MDILRSSDYSNTKTYLKFYIRPEPSREGGTGVTTPGPGPKGGPGQKGARAHVLYVGHKLLLKTNKNFTNLQLL